MAASGGDITVSRAAKTRLRLIRRLVFVAIIVIGVAIALSQFTSSTSSRPGSSPRAPSLGLILGLAARQVLANPLAGILLAITQPIRIGDTVTIDDETGRVDDLTLSYTFIDTGDGRLVIVPNETGGHERRRQPLDRRPHARRRWRRSGCRPAPISRRAREALERRWSRRRSRSPR